MVQALNPSGFIEDNLNKELVDINVKRLIADLASLKLAMTLPWVLSADISKLIDSQRDLANYNSDYRRLAKILLK